MRSKFGDLREHLISPNSCNFWKHNEVRKQPRRAVRNGCETFFVMTGKHLLFHFSTYRRSVPNLLDNPSLKVQPEKKEKKEVPLQRARSLRGRPEVKSNETTQRTTKAKSSDKNTNLNSSLTRKGKSSDPYSRNDTTSLNRSLDSSRRLRTRSIHSDESQTQKKSAPVFKPHLTLATTPTFMK